jgi:Family of unknown function (DUF6311)
VTTSSEISIAVDSSQERPTANAPRPWADSIWFDLAISLLAGLLYTLIMMGPGPLNPRNIGWLIGDPADHFIGWELFRQDPHWHWPLTFTDRVGYPVGESIALMDPNTLLVVLLKPLSPLLPEPFQFFGLESTLGCILQFFFSLRLFRHLLGPNRLGAVLCSFFFLTATPLIIRMGEIYSLTNQWLLIAALLVYVQAQKESPHAVKRFVISALILGAVAVAINPYLAFQTLLVLTAAAGSLVWQRRLPLRKAVALMAVLGVIGVIVADTFGFIIAGGKGYTSFGYRFYALNLLTPFDPTLYGALLSRLLPNFPHVPVRTGNYLGGGVILLGIFLLILVVWQRRKPRAADLRRWGPLFLCCVVLTLMALSTRVMAGSMTVVDFDPRQHLTRFLATLRSSERLFWVPYYTIFTAVLAAPFLLFRRSHANLLLAIVLVVQLADLFPLRERTHTRVNRPWPTPLKSPIWSQLGTVHENLVVLPAYQCGIPSTPATSDGYRIFGLLAVAQHLRTNSYYAGRYTDATRAYHCKQAIAALAEQPLSPDNAYVVTPALAEVIAKGPTGPGKCHEVDGFILCSSKLDFGPDAKAVPENQSR